jgi:3-oxoadipate enol-lactonase
MSNDHPLHLDEYGDPANPALICLHGLGGGGYFFAGLARSLKDQRHILCPDMPGSGFSPRPRHPISFEHFADVVSDLIQRRSNGPIALVGHSMGTIVALKVYARLSSRISSLIFVGGLPAPLLEAQARLRDRAALARERGMAAVAPTIAPIVFSQRSLNAMPDKVAMFQRLLAAGDAEGYAQTALALADASAADVVGQVNVPCLCLTGSEDRYAPPRSAQEFTSTIAGAQYKELPNCAHMPFFEDSKEFNQIIGRFLSR